ncbi:MAG: hypothetical protein BWY09_01970 [Candidatus Hydrogenedentes bacterium ADurb.Bin179]|nr:MAG: hypothetical protein BWY09_01970 [Candidatus Hydrogenedentes bacterium ADurb.Bin179]
MHGNRNCLKCLLRFGHGVVHAQVHTRRRPDGIWGMMTRLFPVQPRLQRSRFQARILHRLRRSLQAVQPGFVQVGIIGLPFQAPDFYFAPVNCNHRLRLYPAQQHFAGDEVVKPRGGGVGFQPERAAQEAV